MLELGYVLEGVQGNYSVVMIGCQQQHGRVLGAAWGHSDVVDWRVSTHKKDWWELLVFKIWVPTASLI